MRHLGANVFFALFSTLNIQPPTFHHYGEGFEV
jgi:hypothetical protein